MAITLSLKEKTGLLLIMAGVCLIATGILGKLHILAIVEIVVEAIILALVAWICFFVIKSRISKLLNETLESLASGVIYFEADGKLSYFNPVAVVMLPELSETGSPENFIGTYKRFLAFIYDRSLDIQDQARLNIEVPYVDISRLLFREVVELSHGKIILVQFYQRQSQEIAVVLTDISMMKNHIEQMTVLTEENRIMIKAIEATGSGMLIAQADSFGEPIIFANEVFADAVGKPLESVLGYSFQKILQEGFEEQADVLRSAVRVARAGSAFDTIWLKARRNKAVTWYALYILFFADAQDREFFVCFLSNQTEAHLAQVKLHQTQKLEAVSKLAGGIAHDFNNILSVIDGYSKIIRRGLDKGQDVIGLFDNIDRSVKRGSEITGRLLTFGQCRTSKKTRLNISAHVRDFEPFLKQMIDENTNMILSIQETPCYVDVSPDAITQILMALVANSREAMPQGGDLIISVSEASTSQILSFQPPVPKGRNYICLQIIDSGIGMDPDILGRVYEPFFTTKDSTVNSGLGMSIVYGLVKEMDAFIDIKSTFGVGTSVSVLIPYQPAPVDPVFAKVFDKEISKSSDETIL